MLRVAIVFLCAASLLTACASGPPTYEPLVADYQPAEARAADLETAKQAAAVPTDEDRMVISTASISMETGDPDAVQLDIISLAYALGGYVLQTERGLTSIRIPSEGYGSALEQIEAMGDVLERKISGRDVTEEYVDLQTRLNNLEKTRQRFLTLLGEANQLDAILRMEKELAFLTERIETLKGKIERLSHLVAYTTITVRASKKDAPVTLGPISWVGKQVYTGIRKLFVW